MWNNTRVTIYQASAKPDAKLLSWDDKFFAEGVLEDFYSAIVWTEPNAQGTAPERLIINTMLKKRVYTMPKLLQIGARCIVFSALSDSAESGTLRSIEEFHIVLREHLGV